MGIAARDNNTLIGALRGQLHRAGGVLADLRTFFALDVLGDKVTVLGKTADRLKHAASVCLWVVRTPQGREVFVGSRTRGR